jgi:hypothetical protein
VIKWGGKWKDQPFVSGIKSTRLVLNGPMKELYIGLGKDEEYIVKEIADVESLLPKTSAADFDLDTEDHEDGLFRNFHALLLRSQTWGRDGTNFMNTFLILEPVPGDGQVEFYRRVGIGAYWNGTFNFDLRNRRTINLV